MSTDGFLYRLLMPIREMVNTHSENIFLGKQLEEVDRVGVDASVYPADNITCEIICIAFNNHELVPMQHKLIQKYFIGAFNYLIADNSSDTDTGIKIRDYCVRNGISYVLLPKNPYKMGSKSHAAAINWVLRNYVEKKKPAYFGFIDHDIFPIRKFDVFEILARQPFYGLFQERQHLWYLWAGFCFFRSAKINFREMDFMPGIVEGIAVDTGGKNWKPLYSMYNKEDISFPPHSYEQLREGDIPQRDMIEKIGEWIHTFNGSYWMKMEKKERLLENYLKSYLQDVRIHE